MTSNKWHMRFMNLAAHISCWSKDPKKQVGAVVTTKNNFVLGIGFNGLPSRIPDTNKILQNKEYKNKLTIHAEVNAIRAANFTGDRIYIYPCLPCPMCLALIMQVNINEIYTTEQYKDRPTAWDKDLVISIAEEHDIEIRYL